MSFSKKESRKLREAYLAGDSQSVALDSAAVLNPASADVKLSMVASKITVQPAAGMTVAVTVSMNGIDFLAGGSATNTAPFTYSTPHLVGVVRLVCSAGAGNVSVLAA